MYDPVATMTPLRAVSVTGRARPASARGTAPAGLSTPCPWCRSPSIHEAPSKARGRATPSSTSAHSHRRGSRPTPARAAPQSRRAPLSTPARRFPRSRVALAGERQQVAVVQQPVEDRGRHHDVAEYLAPLVALRAVRRHHVCCRARPRSDDRGCPNGAVSAHGATVHRASSHLEHRPFRRGVGPDRLRPEHRTFQTRCGAVVVILGAGLAGRLRAAGTAEGSGGRAATFRGATAEPNIARFNRGSQWRGRGNDRTVQPPCDVDVVCTRNEKGDVRILLCGPRPNGKRQRTLRKRDRNEKLLKSVFGPPSDGQSGKAWDTRR